MANRYFLNIGVNFGDTANWSATSGGAGGASVPTNADDVFFDANSGNCTVNASARTAKTLNFTGYTNTITMTNGITVSGSVTLVAAMTIAGASTLTINATSTFTSNGKTWSANLTLIGTMTLTLADNLSVSGLLSTSTNTITVNGTFSINASGGVAIGYNIVQGTGTTTLNLTGGTWSNSFGYIAINTNINGSITISGTVAYRTGTLTYTSGTVTLTGSTLLIANPASLNVSGLTWNNVTIQQATVTLLSDLNINGLLNFGAAGISLSGNFNINAYNGVKIDSDTSQLAGTTTTLNILGGTWSGTSGQNLRINTNINGNITISGTVYYNTGTLTYISGTITTTGSTLLVGSGGGTATLNTNGITWNNVTVNGANTIVLTSDLNINGVLLSNNATTIFNGTFNINVSGGLTLPVAIQQGTGVTTLNLLGGTWSGAGQLRLNTIINGNITISGSVAYNTGTLTYTSGIVTVTGSTLNIGASTTLNTSGMSWNNVTIGGASTISLTSNLYINNTLTIDSATTNTINSNTIYLSGNYSVGSGNNPVLGTSLLYFNGSGTWSSLSSSSTRLNITIDTNGTIYLSGTIRYQNNTINYLKGKIIPLTDNILFLATSTLLNFDKINLRTITILSGQTITMNKFFSGSALIRTTIQSGTAGSNYTISFQDGFEKITKFTKISNCTITNRGQLLCLTDNSNKGGNVGVRYINQMPNGVAKNSASTSNPLGYSVPSFLDSDPNFITK